jgi:nanoRNase/pAp phosphatase (c-di-AMP/oligoRNAs hydrolase)
MDFTHLAHQLQNTLKDYTNILIYIKGSPDPDVIASSFAIDTICRTLGVKSRIVSAKEPSLPQNSAIIEDLDIPVHFEEPVQNIEKYDAYIVLDHQSAEIKEISHKLPCAVHIDHHEPIEEDVPVVLRIISEEVGSASTIVTLMLKELSLDINNSQLSRISTALLYGIKTDTDDYRYATLLDYEALGFLTQYFDPDEIKNIINLPHSPEMVALFAEAIKNQTVYKNWLLSGIGYIDESNRDSIAIIADSLLEREDISTVIVYAAVEKKHKRGLALDASLRTKNENLNVNELIKRIYSDGGGRKYKGAYQVNLDYFGNCPDRDLLWKMIALTTNTILKKNRDSLHLIELKGTYKKLKKRILDILKTTS